MQSGKTQTCSLFAMDGERVPIAALFLKADRAASFQPQEKGEQSENIPQ